MAVSSAVVSSYCLLLALLTTVVVGDEGVREAPVRSHSLHAPYLDANLENRYWSFGGATVVNTNKYIRLTPDRQSKQGWLWSKERLESDNWRVEFEFKVDGAGTRLFGDGMAFWFTTEKENKGPAFGNQANFKGLGVFFDTYSNGKHTKSFPYVGVQVSDGSKPYNVDDDNFENNMGGCEARFRKAGHPTRARVTYFANVVLVELDIIGNNHWTDCAKILNVQLPSSGYIGFTAATGDVADDHDVISLTTTQYILPNRQKPFEVNLAAIPGQITPELIELDKKLRVQARQSNAAWDALLWTVAILLGIVAVIVVVVLVRMNMEKSSKRF